MSGDCRQITISKLMEVNHIEISPPMCFGIGEGYDFRYWIEKSLKIPLIVLSGNYSFEERLFDNLNVRYQKIINNQDEMVAPACGYSCTNTGMGC